MVREAAMTELSAPVAGPPNSGARVTVPGAAVVSEAPDEVPLLAVVAVQPAASAARWAAASSAASSVASGSTAQKPTRLLQVLARAQAVREAAAELRRDAVLLASVAAADAPAMRARPRV